MTRKYFMPLAGRAFFAPLAWIVLLAIAQSAAAQGYAPDKAAGKMTVAESLEVKLVASEPLVRQPVAIEFDRRGRLWVVQYMQYPNPAGLKPVKVDRYSRTVYDRLPEPPPRGPRGNDRVTILLDDNGDGRADRGKDFVTGLNLASGIALGHGGVFVMQAPYLLFYPDRNQDDVPDAEPEVLLKGFGMEDAHSVANSLTWGPDGWLYGCQGSTVTANIRGIEFQQGIWRYHPRTRRFELFCEGGGNSWGLDFDRDGNLLYSTNYGGYCMLHAVQGAYYWKLFGKHGALHNPYAYGYFEHVPHENFTGGHVTVGGVVYQSDLLAKQFRDKYVAADLLGHAMYWHHLQPNGSSFRSRHGGSVFKSNDTWFAPSDVTIGPDGAVYVADWHDQRTAHPDPEASWDRTNGRIYRVQPRGARLPGVRDLARMSSRELVEFSTTNSSGSNSADKKAAAETPRYDFHWHWRHAQGLLAERRDASVVPLVRQKLFEAADDQVALRSLWALYVSGGLDDAVAARALEHRTPAVRSWTVRLLGDEGRMSPALARQLARLAADDSNPHVRCQLACSAKRLPAEQAIAIATRLAQARDGERDPYLPLVTWWAVERHAVSAIKDIVPAFTGAAMWQAPIARETILPRLIRRYAAEGTLETYAACARLLESAPSNDQRLVLVAALDQGLQDQAGSHDTPVQQANLYSASASVRHKQTAAQQNQIALPAALHEQLNRLWDARPSDARLMGLMIRLNSAEAVEAALAVGLDSSAPAQRRAAMLELVAINAPPKAIESLVALATGSHPAPVRSAALSALGKYEQPQVARQLVKALPALDPDLKSRTVDMLLSRAAWAGILLSAVDRKELPSDTLAVAQLRQVSLHKDAALDALVVKHWGSVKPGTPEEKLNQMRRVENELRAAKGDRAAGQVVFTQRCGTCHRLHGQGNEVGPELTHANRKDREYLLVSIVDPNAVIRKEYLNYVITTDEGRILNGLLVGQDAAGVTVVSANNERVTVPRSSIESIEESPVSLMPENVLKDLPAQAVRDLFSYLENDPRSTKGAR